MAQHLGGTHYLYTYYNSQVNRLYYVKGSKGYPWDVHTYDSNSGLIYQIQTEYGEWNGRGYKTYSYTETQRCATPGDDSIEWVLDTSYDVYTDCEWQDDGHVQYGRFKLYGLYEDGDFGGDVGTQDYLELEWLYECSSQSIETCQYRKVSVLTQGLGLVQWRWYQKISGEWYLLDTATFNQVGMGGATAYFPCADIDR